MNRCNRIFCQFLFSIFRANRLMGMLLHTALVLIVCSNSFAIDCPTGPGHPNTCNFGHDSCGKERTLLLEAEKKCSIRGVIQNTASVHPPKLSQMFFSSTANCVRIEPTFGISDSSVTMYTDTIDMLECLPIDFEIECTNLSSSTTDLTLTANDSSVLTLDPIECCALNTGNSCSAGVGQCQRPGVIQCDGTCNAVAALPGVEICDGLDNDCDGKIDEGQVCGYTISGNVTFHDNTPINAVTVNDGTRSGKTGLNGIYKIEKVPNGSYTLTGNKTGYVITAVAGTNPAVVSGANLLNKNFVAKCATGYIRKGANCIPVYSISGKITFQDGTVVSNVSTSDGTRSTSTAVNGTYTIVKVPNGSYTLTGNKTGYVITAVAGTNPAVVSGANLLNKDFVAKCATDYIRINDKCIAVYSISGKVTLQDGTPLLDVVVTGSSRSVTTVVNGTYTIISVPNGIYNLTASKPGFIVEPLTGTNPAIVNGSNLINKDFFARCEEGLSFENGNCVSTEIRDVASDGTFNDFVLVTWNSIKGANTYKVYRSENPGSLGELISSQIPSTRFEDTAAVPDTHYHYTVISDTGIVSNQDEGWRPGASEQCEEGSECIFEQLEPFACASANGFLGQVNIATVINISPAPLNFTVEYRDLLGVTHGKAIANIASSQKVDFIINDMGLEIDTYGTVCVTAETEAKGQWNGGVTLYKADVRDEESDFGTGFDFALYYPFTNPRTGAYTQPVNTFHLGVPTEVTIANWLRITDAEPDDGENLKGVIHFYDKNGEEIDSVGVNLPNGGRFDYPAHERVAGFENRDSVGMARFVPQAKSDGQSAKYYISLGRYYYDCIGASCSNFFTAFIVPFRPSTTVVTSGGVSTTNGELSVIELNNISLEDSSVQVFGFDDNGANAGVMNVNVPSRGTRHQIVNRVGEAGFLSTDSVGAANVTPTQGEVSAISVFYKLDKSGVLSYAYATPLVQSPGVVQVSEFNSFLGQESESEIYNSSDETVIAQLTGRDAGNGVIFITSITLTPKSTQRFSLVLPEDTFGTITLQSDSDALVFRNYVKRGDDYVLPFLGQ